MDALLNSRLSKRFSFQPEITEKIYQSISQVDAVKHSWSISAKLLPQSINKLTHNVIVTSTGASNRIEGNKLTDKEIDVLYKKLRIKKLVTRDEQEVAGYIETLSFIFENYQNIPLSESTIFQLHRDMLTHSQFDSRHRGKYKFGSNRVEATDEKGKVIGVIFDPTPPYLVKKEMQELIDWYNSAKKEQFKHPLLLISNFIFEYLAIHPFQDGNGRTSRLLTNLLLLKEGYLLTQVASHEKYIENQKLDYYEALNKTQLSWKTENEDLSKWHMFFISTIEMQAREALDIMEGTNIEHLLSENQLFIIQWARSTDKETFARKDIASISDMSLRTIEASIKKLLDLNLIDRLGNGRSTRYRLKQ